MFGPAAIWCAAIEAANTIGDLTYAAFACYTMIINLLAAADPLNEVQREAEVALEFAQKAQFGFAIAVIAAQLELIRTLRGLTPIFGALNKDRFDVLEADSRFLENSYPVRPQFLYWVYKLKARFFAGDYASAIEAASRARGALWASLSSVAMAEYHFYSALSLAAFCDFMEAEQRKPHLDTLSAHHRQLALWAEQCPENFESRAALVGADRARLEGRVLDAEQLFRRFDPLGPCQWFHSQ